MAEYDDYLRYLNHVGESTEKEQQEKENELKRKAEQLRKKETELKRLQQEKENELRRKAEELRRKEEELNRREGLVQLAEEKRKREEEKRKKEEAERKKKETECSCQLNRSYGIIRVKGVEFKMIRVEGGTFTMGATSEEEYDGMNRPAHSVTLRGFYIGEMVVTQALWKAVMGNNPSHFEGDNLPVEQVSWYDAREFCSELTYMAGRSFRLPTEAEWEYAARGGNKNRRYLYSGSNSIDEVAWYGEVWSIGKTHPVGRLRPNELGIYDMSGNVWEWCSDVYGVYDSAPQTDPQGPPPEGSDRGRVIRGGGWLNDAEYCRVANRSGSVTPSYRDYSHGFRVVMADSLP